MVKNKLWIPADEPRGEVALDPVNNTCITHISNHPLVGFDEIMLASLNEMRSIGYGMEGVLIPHGQTEISSNVMDWLREEQAATDIGRFVITNCKHEDRVDVWRRELIKVGVTIYSTHILQMNVSFRRGFETAVDPGSRKPNSKLYLGAIASLEVAPEYAAYVGDKFSDARGAKRAKYGMRILTPRLGQEDHSADRFFTRSSQWLQMAARSIHFTQLDSVEIK